MKKDKEKLDIILHSHLDEHPVYNDCFKDVRIKMMRKQILDWHNEFSDKNQSKLREIDKKDLKVLVHQSLESRKRFSKYIEHYQEAIAENLSQEIHQQFGVKPQLSEEEIWKVINSLDVLDVKDYEWRGDNGDYSPNEKERLLMEDFKNWCVENIVEALASKMKGEG